MSKTHTNEIDRLTEMTQQVRVALNETGLYWKLLDILSNQNKILSVDEVEELVDRLEAFVIQETQEIIDER